MYTMYIYIYIFERVDNNLLNITSKSAYLYTSDVLNSHI